MLCELSLTRDNLGKLYGTPPDMAKLAYDVHRMIEQAALYPIDFKVLGKFISILYSYTRETY